MMHNQKIVIYVTGGIASYKVYQLVRLFIKAQNEVRVVLTENAQKFVTPLTFETLTKNKVYVSFEDAFQDHQYVPHIDLAKWADLSIIVPATANIIGKLANGIADDLVTSALSATKNNKYLVPAMNDVMWNNPATQRNISQLKEDGYSILEPVEGFLAEGYSAKGRMPEVEQIFKWVNLKSNSQKPLNNKSILVTAGGIQEPIDPVRYIGNRSSGKMGIEIAKAAYKMGANVTLIIGNTTEQIPDYFKTIQIQTFDQLKETLVENFEKNDALVMSAAVSDYHVINSKDNKIKASKNNKVTLELQRNPNLLKMLGQRKHRQILVGFAAETDNLLENANAELINKNVDMLVANDVSRKDIGFGSNQNEVYLLQPQKKTVKIAKTSKAQIAIQIMKIVSDLLRKEED